MGKGDATELINDQLKIRRMIRINEQTQWECGQ